MALLGSALALPALGQMAAVKRVYVEPLAIKDGQGNVREDLITQVRKIKGVTVVPELAAADAILSGSGEIWVKGYQSLNPRSGRLPSDGTPVYSGFLSVELRNATGDTLWSYLATPGGGSENISKDLSKQVAKHLAEALTTGSGPEAARH